MYPIDRINEIKHQQCIRYCRHKGQKLCNSLALTINKSVFLNSQASDLPVSPDAAAGNRLNTRSVGNFQDQIHD